MFIIRNFVFKALLVSVSSRVFLFRVVVGKNLRGGWNSLYMRGVGVCVKSSP